MKNMKPSQLAWAVWLTCGLILSTAHAAGISAGAEFLLQGKLAEKQKDYKRAVQNYRRAQKYVDTELQSTIGLARIWTDQGQYVDAQELLEGYVSDSNPFQLDVRLALAETLHKKGDLSAALKEIDTIESLHPGFTGTKERRGMIFFDLKKYSESVELLSSVLKDNPGAYAVRLKRAQAQAKMGKVDVALTEYKSLLEEKPHDLDLRYSLGQAYYQAGRFAEAEKEFRFLAKLAPNSIATVEMLGDVAEKQKKYNEAIDFYKKCIEMDPARLDTGQKLAKVYTQLKMFKNAEEEYRREIQINPGFDPAAQQLVAFYQGWKQIDRAGTFLKEYVERFPEKTWSSVQYAKLLMDIGRNESAERVIRKNISAANKPVTALSFYAYLKAKTGKRGDAVDTLSDVEKKPVEDPQARLFTAMTYQELGNNERAVELYKSLGLQGEYGQLAQIKLQELTQRNTERSVASQPGAGNTFPAVEPDTVKEKSDLEPGDKNKGAR